MDPSSSPRPSLLDRLSALLSREPEDRGDLLEVLRAAAERDLIDADTLAMIEGALQIADLEVRDVMVPRGQMDVVSVGASLGDATAQAIFSGHSRLPVIDDDRDDVVGILLVKDLLRLHARIAPDLKAVLRPAVFVPETKRLDELLREFRAGRQHMAIVVDEYGAVAGLITIENVLEQIVGNIEDEYDTNEDGADQTIVADPVGRFRVRGGTTLAALADALGEPLPDAEPDAATVGDYILTQFGRVPRRDETLERRGLRFQVLRADVRSVHTVLVERLPEPEGEGA